MKFYSINKILDECNNFFKPVEELYKTPINEEAERIKAQANSLNFLKGEIKC